MHYAAAFPNFMSFASLILRNSSTLVRSLFAGEGVHSPILSRAEGIPHRGALLIQMADARAE